MDITTVTNFLVDNHEFVDEDIEQEIREVLESPQQEEALKVFFKKNFPDLSTTSFFVQHFKSESKGSVEIIKSFEKTPSKRTIQDFVKHFTVRFKHLEGMLKNRSELQGLSSIARIRSKKERETVSLIGMVLDVQETKNKHIILTLEDLSGTIKVLIHNDNKDLLAIAKDIVLDETIGIVGSSGGEIVFANTIIFPDIPLNKELRKSPYDHYVVFFGDIHFGSKEFLKKEFQRLLLWLNGKLGSLKQREMAKKVKYVVIPGDIIEGAGIYPGQENDLSVISVYKQYELSALYLKKIPSHIKIIICAGNHDVGRIAEPQLPLPKEYAKDLWEMENVIMVSNPSVVALDKTEDFPGINVLLYHGYSLVYYADAIPSIREKGGQKASDEIMKFLLQKRHLAPSHGSSLYIPDPVEDALLIDPIPDIFVSGHIHRAQTTQYRNITCIQSSSWTAITEDQEKRGLEPQPGRAFCVSLKTREVKLLNFSTIPDTKSVAEYRRLLEEQRQKDKVKS